MNNSIEVQFYFTNAQVDAELSMRAVRERIETVGSEMAELKWFNFLRRRRAKVTLGELEVSLQRYAMRKSEAYEASLQAEVDPLAAWKSYVTLWS